ncbi:MAG: anaerobic ribonucleoside-triphosphate reductase activating protein [Minisyncoccales bacterium]
MKIAGWQKLTLIDYPGRLAATVFLAGCNFHCPFCYSAELVLPEKIKEQPVIDEADFFSFLKKRKKFLDGVVICGGEPTLNQDLPQFCQKIKKLGYLVKLDTNGSQPLVLKKLIEEKLIDYVAMDVKAPLETAKYEKATGVKVNLADIKQSIKIIKTSAIDYEFRTTVVPTIQTAEDIGQLVQAMAPAKRYYLQKFLPQKTLNPDLEKIKPYSDDFLLNIKKRIAGLFEICEIR